MMNYKHVIVLGHGRSGTNWLSRVLDLSPYTYCRVEPNELNENPMGRLPTPWVVGVNGKILDEKWNSAVYWIHTHFGERDWLILVEKNFINLFVQRVGLYRIFAGKSYRRILAFFVEQMKMHEFIMPNYIFNMDRLRDALLVMKINQAPEWADWVLRNRSDTCVIQIVRHPGGVLNSWKSRYLLGECHDYVLMNNRNRLKMIANNDEEWEELFGDIDKMQLPESELWFWRYSTEMVHRAGKDNDSYVLCLFENLAVEPTRQVKNIYEHLGLEWSLGIEKEIKKQSKNSREIAQKWRESVTSDEVDIIDKILAGSAMQQWWDH